MCKRAVQVTSIDDDDEKMHGSKVERSNNIHPYLPLRSKASRVSETADCQKPLSDRGGDPMLGSNLSVAFTFEIASCSGVCKPSMMCLPLYMKLQ